MSEGPKLLEHWLPPEGAGAPVACLATTYAFDADFFTQDCLSRFLQLDCLTGEGDRYDDIGALLEEEDRLTETQVTVLADRSCNPEGRNLRWDLLPVGVPGGLLHAKAAVLVWEHALRLLVGSANLTPAGYRSQVELMAAFDVADGSSVPKAFAGAFLDELEDLLVLAPADGDQPGPLGRAAGTLALARRRVESLDLPDHGGRLRVALAPSRPGHGPLDALEQVWSGEKPRWATAVSPFWDKDSAPVAAAIVERLVTRAPRNDPPEVWFTVPVAQLGEECAAAVPRSIVDAVPARVDACIQGFPMLDDEPRLLHAKALVYESRSWIAAMIGSSNLTQAGLGLRPTQGHRELNVWFGCRYSAPEAKLLTALAVEGDAYDVDEIDRWDEGSDADETIHPAPPGIVGLLLVIASGNARLEVQVDARRLPDQWALRLPDGAMVTEQTAWEAAGRPDRYVVDLPAGPFPQAVTVDWTLAGEPGRAAFPVNVADPTQLPPTDELRDLPADVLLDVLASTRPVHRAIAHELRRLAARQRDSGPGEEQLDALKRFDSSALLLPRTRHVSEALWGLERRLARPASSLEALDWRLNGPVGPLALARRLVTDAASSRLLDGEARFVIAELALTVKRVDWGVVARSIGDDPVTDLVRRALSELTELADDLRDSSIASLDRYLDAVFAEVAR